MGNRLYSVPEILELARHLDREELLGMLEALAHECDATPVGTVVRERVERDHPERIGDGTRILDELAAIPMQLITGEVGLERLFEIERSARELSAARSPMAEPVYATIVDSFGHRAAEPLLSKLDAEARSDLRAIAHRYILASALEVPFEPELFESAIMHCARVGVGVAQPLMAARTIAGAELDLEDMAGRWLRYLKDPRNRTSETEEWFDRWLAEATLMQPGSA